jgi:hypothetical protein
VRPYVVKKGDFLLRLAAEFGFDADTVWQDPSNEDLRALRSDPNILLAGDLLYIPDPPIEPPPMTSLVLGSTNAFVAPDPPTMTLTHRFIGDDPTTYASKSYTVQELDQLTGLMSDGDGVVTFEAPVTLDTATVVFTDTGESWPLAIGDLDPINSPPGIFQRLQHLGYIDAEIEYDMSDPSNNLGVMRSALLLLDADNGEAAAASSPPPSAPASSDPEPTPDAAPASGSDGSTALTGGLADDGTLDAETSSLLLKVYGC